MHSSFSVLSLPTQYRNIIGVCIGKEELSSILSIPIVFYTEGYKSIERDVLIDRIDYLAKRRNKAVEITLEKYPSATDILMIDSYYVPQNKAVEKLIEDYRIIDRNMILGATIWAKLRTRISQIFHNHLQFYDQWAVPEARFLSPNFNPSRDWLTSRFIVPLKGLYRVCSVGGCYIFPRKLWDDGLRYATISDLHGCEHNYLCESTYTPKYLDFNVKLYRKKIYSIIKCVRCSLGAILHES